MRLKIYAENSAMHRPTKDIKIDRLKLVHSDAFNNKYVFGAMGSYEQDSFKIEMTREEAKEFLSHIMAVTFGED